MRLTVLPLKSSLWSSHCPACCEMLCCFPAHILSGAIVFPESHRLPVPGDALPCFWLIPGLIQTALAARIVLNCVLWGLEAGF